MQAACFDGGDFKRGFNLQINFWSAAEAATSDWLSNDDEARMLEIELKSESNK